MSAQRLPRGRPKQGNKKPSGLSSYSSAFIERLDFDAIVQGLAGTVTSRMKIRRETNGGHIRVDVR